MKKTEEILNEIRAISPVVAEISSSMPFSVPDGYFQQFEISMLSIVKTEMPGAASDNSYSIVIPPLNNETPFSVPDGYFDSFAERMIKLVKEENEVSSELREISSMLADIPKSNPYYLPENYFSTVSLAEIISDRKTFPARVVSFNSWKRLAVAAAVIGVILTAGIFYFNSRTASENDPFEKFSVEAMENFLSTDDPGLPLPPSPNTDNFSFALIDINDKTISELLEGVDDNAINEFVKNNPVGDNATSSN